MAIGSGAVRSSARHRRIGRRHLLLRLLLFGELRLDAVDFLLQDLQFFFQCRLGYRVANDAKYQCDDTDKSANDGHR